MQGRTVCYHHGGKAGRPIKTGRYSKLLKARPDWLEAYERFRDDPALMETANEIALLRALVERWIDRYGDHLSTETIGQAQSLIDAVSKLVDRRHRQIYTEATSITRQQFAVFAGELLDLVRQYLGDHARFGDFLHACRNLRLVGPLGAAASMARLAPGEATDPDN